MHAVVRHEAVDVRGTKTDFEHVMKVDNHLHLASAATRGEILEFIKSKYKDEGDLVVLEHDGSSVTLKEAIDSVIVNGKSQSFRPFNKQHAILFRFLFFFFSHFFFSSSSFCSFLPQFLVAPQLHKLRNSILRGDCIYLFYYYISFIIYYIFEGGYDRDGAIDIDNLTVDSLDVEATVQMFQRFDNFNDSYNPFGTY